jgi:hypothetical protein
VHYLLGLACELNFIERESPKVVALLQRYDELLRALAGLIRVIEAEGA